MIKNFTYYTRSGSTWFVSAYVWSDTKATVTKIQYGSGCPVPARKYSDYLEHIAERALIVSWG